MKWHRASVLLGLGSGVLAVTATVVSCVGDDPTTTTPSVADSSASCALLEGGPVWCWGNDRNGELGRGTGAGGIQLTPTPVAF